MTDMSLYENWYSEASDNQPMVNERCGFMDGEGTWHSEDCASSQQFKAICKRGLFHELLNADRWKLTLHMYTIFLSPTIANGF